MTRTRLPNRRPSVTREIEFKNRRFAVSAGLDVADGGKPAAVREVFVKDVSSGDAKEGQDLAQIIDDASVAISIALQYGATTAALAKSMARLPTAPVMPADLDKSDGGATARVPATVIGAIADALVEMQAEVAEEDAA